MKCIVMIMLAVFMAASYITKAGDTLRIRSVRTPNLCSDDKTFLLTASIGEVFFSDSLMYFDIALKYDTSVIRPTQGFPQGTLASQLDFGEDNPAYNFRTPGEIRVSAFSISSHAKGNFPLIAIGGVFVGDCQDHDSITVPFALDFNEEFKRKVTVHISETFKAVAIPVVSPDIGPAFAVDTVLINAPDSLINLTVDIPSLELANTPVALTVAKLPTSGISIDTVLFSGTTTDSIVRKGDDTVIVYYVAPLGLPQAQVVVSASHERDNDSTMFTVSVQSLAVCGCIEPTKKDSVKVVTRKQTVSSLSDVDEGPVTIKTMDETIEVQGVHGQPGFLTVYALNGPIVNRTAFDGSTNRVRVPIHDLPTGVYYVVATYGGLTQTNKLLK